jgi:pseudouridine-5'-phosphate glycosidase
MHTLLALTEEVRSGLADRRPVVALESTLISHGMPYPKNVETALEAESLVRECGAVPATIALLNGKVRIGITAVEIESLAKGEDVHKVSRKDLSYVLSRGAPGATTVCATMIAARMAGIKVFATGGIGGVHRHSEATGDVSADLVELARTPVVVVSAGAKAILDLPKTLEYLETQGVPVLGYRTEEFPAFYSRESGQMLSQVVDTPDEVCRVFRIQRDLGMSQGLLIANPIPEKHALPAAEVEGYIEQALRDMEQDRVTGKQVTPYLLARMGERSGGRTLIANVALYRNNVRLACDIAKCLERSEGGGNPAGGGEG